MSDETDETPADTAVSESPESQPDGVDSVAGDEETPSVASVKRPPRVREWFAHNKRTVIVIAAASFVAAGAFAARLFSRI